MAESALRTQEVRLEGATLEKLIIHNAMLINGEYLRSYHDWHLIICNRESIEHPKFFAVLYIGSSLFHVENHGSDTAYGALERLFHWSADAVRPYVAQDDQATLEARRQREAQRLPSTG